MLKTAQKTPVPKSQAHEKTETRKRNTSYVRQLPASLAPDFFLTLSTFSRVFADVSTYGTPHCCARPWHSASGTFRLSFRSHLLPTSRNGIFSSFFTRNICSLQQKRQTNPVNFILITAKKRRPTEILVSPESCRLRWLKTRTGTLHRCGSSCHGWPRSPPGPPCPGYRSVPPRRPGPPGWRRGKRRTMLVMQSSGAEQQKLILLDQARYQFGHKK